MLYNINFRNGPKLWSKSSNFPIFSTIEVERFEHLTSELLASLISTELNLLSHQISHFWPFENILIMVKMDPKVPLIMVKMGPKGTQVQSN